ncbi:uroporphyrinogen-III synthase [Leucobacter weissii]|uniref:Uroporphyrinogen-III synthase n=1 Tax=Leucobacter weissii TaxID=1983706 RepID=A0A939MJE8_9MICO|nr:uroporphyrinogen-III synthase [Leucobacter weissii]MBO1902058.1 uroporphyrinogen-III synthase [Leucobacter weissii]
MTAVGGTETARGALDGLRILVPRGGDWGEGIAARISARGGRPVVAPLLETRPPIDGSGLSLAVEEWNRGRFGCLAVTSQNAVAALGERGIRPVAGGLVAAVGPATATALRGIGLPVDVQPETEFSGRGLARALLGAFELRGAPAFDEGTGAMRVLLPVSELAGDELPRALREAGHAVERVTAYRTEVLPADPRIGGLLTGGDLDAVLVTSGSAASALLRHYPGIHRRTALAAIGEPTARALVDGGLHVDVVAAEHTVGGLLDALAAALAPDAPPRSEETR